LIYVANWPEARKKAWKALLHARAIENMAYVCGVNRVGVDGKGFLFRGDSMIYNAKGKKLADAGKREEITRHAINPPTLRFYQVYERAPDGLDHPRKIKPTGKQGDIWA